MHRIVNSALARTSLGAFAGISAVLLMLATSPTSAQDAKANSSLLRLPDLMNDAMQVHHTKLWLAGHANNWILAAYEVRKIKETIEEVKEAIVDIQASSPQWRNVSINQILNNVSSEIGSLDQAVQAKDADRFSAAYGKLTDTCNACHVSLGQAQIKVVEPASNGLFADQDFTTDGSR